MKASCSTFWSAEIQRHSHESKIFHSQHAFLRLSLALNSGIGFSTIYRDNRDIFQLIRLCHQFLLIQTRFLE